VGREKFLGWRRERFGNDETRKWKNDEKGIVDRSGKIKQKFYWERVVSVWGFCLVWSTEALSQGKSRGQFRSSLSTIE
jgi:hypothetical protein